MFGTTENFAEGTRIPMLAGRFFNGTEVQYRKNVVVLGNTPYQLLFAPSGIDPIGKTVRVGSERFEVVGVFDKRPSAGGFNLGQDDFVVIPYTAYQRIFGLHVGPHRPAAATIICRSRSPCCRARASRRTTAIADVERVMRIRHGLKLDEPNDFDLVTQDAVLKLWDQISQGTFFALVVISSIALMVGGIGVMAIMSISVTERTREIGVRKALGARRAEILFQFLMEAVVPDVARRHARHRARQRHRLGRPPRLGLPDLAALVVVRDRPRLLGLGRHLLRHVSRRSKPRASIRSKRCATSSRGRARRG